MRNNLAACEAALGNHATAIARYNEVIELSDDAEQVRCAKTSLRRLVRKGKR